MPYWSSPRVGAVGGGTTAPSKRHGKSNRNQNRKKGITMEDLKKQTALRLAQEQGREPVPPPAEPVPTSSFTQPKTMNPPSTTVITTPQRKASSGDCSEMGANPKLPHGLTVQELKEMTKARLQAEAVEFIPSSCISSPSPSSLLQQQQQLQQPSNLSLHSTGSMTMSSQHSLNPPPGFRHSDWETGSVSTAHSHEAAIPFCRSASYPNRQRAATLSPSAGDRARTHSTASLPNDLVPGLVWDFHNTGSFFCDVNDDLASILKLSGAEEDDDDV